MLNKFHKNLIILVAFLVCSCGQNPTPQIENSSPPFDEETTKIIRQKEVIAPFFKPMQVQEWDWLKSFPEDGQTFEQYLKSNPTLPTSERQTIYIQPVGEFSESQKKVLQLTANYMKAFYNLPVKLNEIKLLGNVPKDLSRVNSYDKSKQIRTTYFLDNLLPKLLPNDAAAFICFTNSDLYPNENMNFVFGQATFQTRVGVYSLARLGNSEKEFRLFLDRTLKIAMHETGHMFSMLHCTKYECLMSGTNHLGETDRRPLDVCPECMAKIAWAMKYQPVERYQNLAKFWKEQNDAALSGEFEAKEEAVRKVLTELR